MATVFLISTLLFILVYSFCSVVSHRGIEEGDCEYECISLNFIETDICIRTDLQVRNNSFKSQRVKEELNMRKFVKNHWEIWRQESRAMKIGPFQEYWAEVHLYVFNFIWHRSSSLPSLSHLCPPSLSHLCPAAKCERFFRPGLDWCLKSFFFPWSLKFTRRKPEKKDVCWSTRWNTLLTALPFITLERIPSPPAILRSKALSAMKTLMVFHTLPFSASILRATASWMALINWGAPLAVFTSLHRGGKALLLAFIWGLSAALRQQ